MAKRVSPRDYKYLSAYLDGQLTGKDQQRMETRLAVDEELRAELVEIRRMKVLLRSLPRQRAPRNFTLTPAMLGVRQRKTRYLYPVMGFASALASLLFVLIVLGDFLGFLPSTTPGGSGLQTAQDAAPLALVVTEAYPVEPDAQLKSVVPEEDSTFKQADSNLTEETSRLAPSEEVDAFSLQAPAPEDVVLTDVITPAQTEVDPIVEEFGMGGGMYTETLEMPAQVFTSTLPAEQFDTILSMDVNFTPTPTFTPTPMPTETPVPTEIPVATPMPTSTPTPMPTETPLVLPKALVEAEPTLTPVVEVLAMADESTAVEETAALPSNVTQDTNQMMPGEQVSQPSVAFRPIMVIQIGLLLVAVITGGIFLILRDKEK